MSGVIRARRVSMVVGLVASLAMLVLGCTMVGPDYVRPPVHVEQTWLDTGDKRVHTSTAVSYTHLTLPTTPYV